MSERAPDKQPDEEDRHLASALGIGAAIGAGAGTAVFAVTGGGLLDRDRSGHGVGGHGRVGLGAK